MSKKCYRFFGGVLKAQENWLNKMSSKGYRLIRTTKAMYEFEECEPGKYFYKIEYIGNKSQESAKDYVDFLKDCQYKVFYKNMNLNYSIGKVTVRPWAEGKGKIATNSTTYNKELLIVEKENDGKSFELHTTHEDKKEYFKSMRKPWIYSFIIFTALYFVKYEPICLVLGGVSLLGILRFQIELMRLNKENNINEW